MFDADLDSDSLEARPCSAEDLTQLQLTWPPAADVNARHFSRQRSGTQTLVVAWQHREAVGSVVIRWQSADLPEIDSTYPGAVEIAHLQVRPDRRRRGVGTCLLLAAKGQARLREVPWLRLGVGVENPEAAALYERLGYTRTGIVVRSEYQFVDENGIEQNAVEWDEYMIMDIR